MPSIRPSGTKLLAAAALALLPGGAAFPQIVQDYGYHLEPDDGLARGGVEYQDYMRVLSAVLRDSFEPDVLARVVAIFPRPFNESAIGIRRVQGEYKLFVLSSSKLLSRYMLIERWKRLGASAQYMARLQDGYPADYHDVQVNRCEIAIDASLGAQFLEMWKLILLQTRKADHSTGRRGPETTRATYLVWSDDVAGATSYVAEGSKLDLFLRFMDRVSRPCLMEGWPIVVDQNQLRREVDTLLTRLQQ